MTTTADVLVLLNDNADNISPTARGVANNREAIIKTAEDLDSLSADVTAIQNHISGSIQFLSALPTITTDYTEYTTTRFSAKERCEISLVTDKSEDENAPYEKIVTTTATQNKYGFATLDLGDTTSQADTIMLEMRVKIPNTRCYFGVGNMENRPGESYRGTYTHEDIAFFFGTKDGNNIYANGKIISVANPIINAWATVRMLIDPSSKTVSYRITKDDGLLYSGSAEFADAEVTSITGIEMYSWVNSTEIDVGDISVAVTRGAKENVLYAISNESGGYDLYAYKDGIPRKLSDEIAQMDAEIRAAIAEAVEDAEERIAAEITAAEERIEEDIAQTDVGELKSQLDNIIEVNTSVNLFNPDTVITGQFYSNPNNTDIIRLNESSAMACCCIEVEEGKKYTVSGTSYKVLGADVPGHWVRNLGGNASTSLDNVTVNIPVGSGIKYMYLSWRFEKYPIEIYMIVEGSTLPESYVPYYVPYQSLKNISVDYELIKNIPESKDAYYVSSSGSDSNKGTANSPFATVTKAVESGASVVYLYGGIYEQQIDLTTAGKELTIKPYQSTKTPVFIAPDRVKIDAAELVDGYENVYKAEVSSSVMSAARQLCQDGIADVSTEIPDAERMPQQRGKRYRLDDTRLLQYTGSGSLADKLTYMDNASGYYWYYDSTEQNLYFTAPNNNFTAYPICANTDTELFKNIQTGMSLKVSGLDLKYFIFNINGSSGSIVSYCKAGKFTFGQSHNSRFVCCEAYGFESGTRGGDGFGGSADYDGEPFAHQTGAVLENCWSHDSADDGYSEHQRSETTIIGGLYEYNGKAGLTPAQGAHCTCIGVYSRKNYNGFFCGNSVTNAEGGYGTQMECIDCVAEDNYDADGYSGHGFLVTSGPSSLKPNKMICINCVAKNNEKTGFRVGRISTHIYDYGKLINCYASGNDKTTYAYGNLEIVSAAMVTA